MLLYMSIAFFLLSLILEGSTLLLSPGNSSSSDSSDSTYEKVKVTQICGLFFYVEKQLELVQKYYTHFDYFKIMTAR